jgi:type I restriction enzyme, S subunit
MNPGYKKTEVGVIPDEWRVHRLADLLQGSRSIRYGIVQPGKYDANGCFMLRSQDYSKGWAGPDRMHKVFAQLENQYRNARIHRDDLVMTVVGAGIGQVVTVPDWLDGAMLSRSTARIAIDNDKAAPSFVKSFLDSPIGKRQILDCQKEGAQPVVSCPDLAKFFVAGPPLPEQRAIAETLSDVDALLGALDRLIAKKRDLKQAAMQQLLTGQTRLPGFHGEWEVKRFGDVAVPRRDRVDPRRTGIHDFCIELEHIASANGELLGSIRTGMQSSLKSVFRPGDVLFGKLRAYLRKYWLATRSGVCSTEIWVFTPTESAVTTEFLFQIIKTDGFIEAASNSYGTHMPRSDWNVVKTHVLKIPPLAEQTAIAEVLSEMDAELVGLEQRRVKTRALKQGMMQELLTGKTRLTSPQSAHD